MTMFNPADPAEPVATLADRILAVAATAAFLGLAHVVTSLPAEPADLAVAVRDRLADTGLGNPVSAVLLDFRAFDTLLEKAVLIAALIGLWTLSPGIDPRARAASLRTARPAEPQLVLLLEMLVPLALLTAFYLLWIGADEPGGAFQAGTLAAAVGVLLVLGRIVEPPPHGHAILQVAALSGFVVFAGVGLATMLVGGGFLDYPARASKPIILLIEATITLSVGAVLFLLAAGPPDADFPDDGG